MKRKAWIGILCGLFTLATAAGLSACGGVGDEISASSGRPISGNGCVHAWETSVTKEADCENNGLAVHVCSLCGEDYSEILHALGHDEKTHAAQEITCEQDGWAEYVTCERDGCDYSTYEYQKALGHKWENEKCTRCKIPYFTQSLGFELSDDKTYYIVLWDTDDTNTEIIIPATYNGLPVKEIRGFAFSYNKTLTSVQLPDSITKIGGYAFHECTALKSINFPKSLETIGENAFDGCSGLTGKLVLPNGIKFLDYKAFGHCEGLTEVVLPKSLEALGLFVFEGCTGLKSVDLGGVFGIGACAFTGCSALETIKISKALQHIDDNNFFYSPIKTVYYEGNESDWEKLIVGIGANNDPLLEATIHYNSY